MDDLSVTQLRALVEFSKLGTLAKVADSLGYTTGAISQQLSSLEKRMGVPLLERVGRRSRLTTAGAVLVEYAQRILALAQETEASVRDAADAMSGTVRLGIFASSSAHVAARAAARMQEEFGLLRIHLVEVDLEEAISAVQRREVDVCLTINYSSAPIPREAGVTYTQLVTEQFGLAVPADSPLGADGDAPVPLADFAVSDWIFTPPSTYFGQAVRAACRRHGFEPNVVHHVTDTVSCLDIVMAGLGVTPVTELMAATHPDPGFRFVRVADFFEREIVLVHPDAHNRRSTHVLIERLREALR